MSRRGATGRRVVIVGGGYVGWELAQALDATAAVTLVEPREAFVHTPAMIRALLEPTLLERAILPYDRLLRRGTVVRARVASVDGEGVTLADGARLAADYLVVATGSGYAAPFKPQGDSVESLRAASRAAREALLAAHSVAIVGAGAVGTELAGEISHALPRTRVTLIGSDARLFPAYPAALGTRLQRKLQAAGVEVITGRRATGMEALTAPGPAELVLDDGRRLQPDLVFPVLGTLAEATLLHALPGAVPGTQGRVKVDAWMRPSQLPNVFAAGDAADMGDGMTIVATRRQIPWLARTLRALMDGGAFARVPAYTPYRRALILLPLGPQRGNSWLPIGVVGDFLTSRIKGRELFVPKYRRAFGLD